MRSFDVSFAVSKNLRLPGGELGINLTVLKTEMQRLYSRLVVIVQMESIGHFVKCNRI